MPRLGDGVRFELGETVVADARSAVGDVNVVSHAHADHLPRQPRGPVVCSAATAALIEARTGANVRFVEGTERVTLLPAGHVVGSRAALIADGGRRHLFTGDVSTRDRGPLTGFSPVSADELVVETTYGHPDYRFPEQSELEGRIVDWIADHDDVPLFLFGYSLGRAQAILRLAAAATDRRVVAHDSIHRNNRAIERTTDRTFRAVPESDVDRLTAEDVYVVPTHLARRDQVRKRAARLGAVKVGFSGWAVDDSFRYRGGYDEAFVLSDHCDFDELVALVRAVDPERVYTHHGFAEGFAEHLAGEHGYEAYALKRNQATLAEF